MKFKVERDVLGEAVSWVARALPSRPVVPVLSGMLIRADVGGLTLSCFDYEVSARMVVPADVGEPGTALVPGRLLAEITRSLPGQDVEVAMIADMVTLTCGSAEFALVSLGLEDYPQLPELPDVVGTVDGGDLATAAAQVVPSASRDDTLPMLTGVCLEIDADTMRLATTDRYRLAVRQIGWTAADDSTRISALVPARTLADIAKTMSAGVPVTVAMSQADTGARTADGTISFEGGGRRLTARLIAGEFIRYQARFPDSFDCRAELAAGPFIEAVRRVSLVAERMSPVRLAFTRDAVTIEARSDGRARAVETMPAHFAGEDQVIAFNPHYLLDGLAAAALCGHGRATAAAEHAAGDDSAGAAHLSGRVRLQFTSPAKPALITWAEDADANSGGEVAAATPAFRYLVVPLRAPAGT